MPCSNVRTAGKRWYSGLTKPDSQISLLKNSSDVTIRRCCFLCFCKMSIGKLAFYSIRLIADAVFGTPDYKTDHSDGVSNPETSGTVKSFLFGGLEGVFGWGGLILEYKI